MGTLVEFVNDTKLDENCEHCRVKDMEVHEKLNVFSEKNKVTLGKHVTESTVQILNIQHSKKICRINKRTLGVINLQHVTVAEHSKVFHGSRAWKTK